MSDHSCANCGVNQNTTICVFNLLAEQMSKVTDWKKQFFDHPENLSCPFWKEKRKIAGPEELDPRKR